MESATALLLRRTRYSETSLIITWLTEEHGKVKTIAKGALRPKGAFSGKLDLFFEVAIAYQRSSRSELHTLREAALKRPFDGLRRDFTRMELACYFVELVELAIEPDHPEPEIYDLLQRALRYLEGNPANLRALLHFENELATALGIQGDGPGIAAHAALLRTLHRLPAARPSLLAKLH